MLRVCCIVAGGQGCRFQPISDEWYEDSAVYSELLLKCEVGVAPELVKCMEVLAGLTRRVVMSLRVEPSPLRVTPRYLACCSIVTGVPSVNVMVLSEVGERKRTHFLRFKCKLL